MEKDLKDILLKDLCARLPYQVKASYCGVEEYTIDAIYRVVKDWYEVVIGQCDLPIEQVKPYLYPLSSMTEEQCEEFRQVSGLDTDLDSIKHGRVSLIGDIAIDCLYDAIDWFNKNHFDYRGLIEKGLAVDATGLNIYEH